MIVSDNEIIINAALKNYNVFKVPANRVVAKKSQRYYTNLDKADLDYRTSENKIGEIVNLSQELNTLMWDVINKSGKSVSDAYEDIKEIYHDICILNVLSCVEIDKAKKEFDISSTTEINEIKTKWSRETFDNKVIKPAFLGFIAQTKGYRNPERKKYNYHKTSMDYLLKVIGQSRSDKTIAHDFVPLSECFVCEDENVDSVNWRQIKKIVDMCEITVSSINAVWSKDYYTNEEKYNISNRYKEDLAFDVYRMKINERTMFELIRVTDSKKYSRISKLLFWVLFNHDNQTIMKLMKPSDSSHIYIDESKDGDIDLYGLMYKKFDTRDWNHPKMGKKFRF